MTEIYISKDNHLLYKMDTVLFNDYTTYVLADKDCNPLDIDNMRFYKDHEVRLLEDHEVVMYKLINKI